MNSCPTMSPLFMPGMALQYMCRSEPQMAVEVTRRMMSRCAAHTAGRGGVNYPPPSVVEGS